MSDRVFVDSSIIVGIMLDEDGIGAALQTIDAAQERYTSAVALLEVVMRLSGLAAEPPTAVEADVRQLLARLRIKLIDVGDRTATAAVRAFADYGKGRHPARLNLGDCFSYACAKEHGLTLLYKGEDFAQTDLA